MLPNAFVADNVISPDAVTVPVNVGAVSVRPAIVVTVAPDVIDVEPRVGAEYPAAGVTHLSPGPAVESALRYCALVPTPSLPTVLAAVPTIKSPLVVTVD
jgi:hypothetical protein